MCVCVRGRRDVVYVRGGQYVYVEVCVCVCVLKPKNSKKTREHE